MAVKVNVGGSRKVSQDYNSTGYSVSIDAELSNEVLTDPDALAGNVNDLFQMVDDLLDEQVRKNSDGGEGTTPTRDNGNGHGGRSRRHSRSGSSNGNGNGRNGHRPITSAQERAITNMARRLGQDADEWANSDHGVPVKDLSVKQASQLIDAFKQEFEAAGTEGARR
ncbi:MAG: hypothetical protein GC159_16270 [Phycisphaera sp.]|nr:hypothetical protein [Phycisphaera sp.]